MLKFLFLFSKIAKLRLGHFNIVLLVLVVIVVIFSGAEMNLTDAVMFNITATFLDYSISEVIEEIGKFETASSTITITNNRHRIQL